jgi:hypothetical protein
MVKVKKLNDLKRNMAALIAGMVITLVVGLVIIVYGFHLGQGRGNKPREIISQTGQTAQGLSKGGL